nr:MAG TPA: hypothetical protein [Caudoviricetes sp.]
MSSAILPKPAAIFFKAAPDGNGRPATITDGDKRNKNTALFLSITGVDIPEPLRGVLAPCQRLSSLSTPI